MITKGNILAEKLEDGSFKLTDEIGNELLTTKHPGIAFVLEELLSERGSEIDLELGWWHQGENEVEKP